jgi:hypothetical protein
LFINSSYVVLEQVNGVCAGMQICLSVLIVANEMEVLAIVNNLKVELGRCYDVSEARSPATEFPLIIPGLRDRRQEFTPKGSLLQRIPWPVVVLP